MWNLTCFTIKDGMTDEEIFAGIDQNPAMLFDARVGMVNELLPTIIARYNACRKSRPTENTKKPKKIEL